MPHAPARPVRLVVHAALLVTGAATLALELIASRLLTPYVGGGLVVWTAILSVTLLALALGYHVGSRWSAHAPARRFARIPALAAIVLGVTGALAPMLLPQLAVGGALTGAFVGVVLVLAPALVLLSAMGPLAIALLSTGAGDSGAGEVFAISTVGSVAGVFLAAFALLPHMAPPATLAVLAGALVAVALLAARALGELRAVAVLLPGAVAAIALAGAALLSAPDAVAFGAWRVTHVATERSAHATVIVADVTRPGRDGTVRLYLEENQVQSAAGRDLPGTPLVYAALSRALIAETVAPGGRVLVLGLAGGVIASDLVRAGFSVTAVDVNPAAADVARRWFDLAPEIDLRIADARLFLEDCAGAYDAIFVDAFSGLEIPEHLVTRETFAAASACLAPRGALVVNAVVPPLDTRPSRRLLAAIAAAMGGPVAVYEDVRGAAGRLNRVVLAGPAARTPPTLAIADWPSDLFARAPRRLVPELVTPADLAGTPPLTDWSNDFALAIARATPAPTVFPVPASWY
ncbi:fused MFS/spermidine synthase [Salinarimonas chemoclinalis]|uniref:fused MFS/spermidine synthase n=1 Tax=Salinarimonas chemoclinalis TaxID=3241599 RepID=UPI0035562D8D